MATKYEPADPALTGYIRMRIRQEVDAGTQLKDLALRAGVAKSHPSQVIAGTLGVGRRAAFGYAMAFKFPNVDELMRTAHAWWASQGAAGAELQRSPPTPAMQEAIDYVLELGQGNSAQLATILVRYAHPDFRERDVEWWIQTLLAELRRDLVALRADKQARKAESTYQSEVRSERRELTARTKLQQPDPPPASQGAIATSVAPPTRQKRKATA